MVVWNEDETVAFRVGVGIDNAVSLKHRSPSQDSSSGLMSIEGSVPTSGLFDIAFPFVSLSIVIKGLLRY
jgi:hypothetical protein